MAYYFVQIAMLFIGNASLYAQIDNIPFTRLTEEDGLPSNEVYCFLQDRRGYIWIGTSEGLSRYNGISFKNYYADADDPNTLSFNRIVSLYEDPQGILWIGTDGRGLNRFDPVTETFTHYLPDKNDPTTISGNQVRGLYEDRQGHLWMGTGKGINLMDRQKGTFTHWKPYPYPDTVLTKAQMWGNMMRQIVEDPVNDSILWLASLGGFYRFNKITKQFRDFFPENIPHSVEGLYQHSPDSFWLGTWGKGLMLYNKKKDHWSTFMYDHTTGISLGNIVKRIVQKSDHELWIATLDKGLGIFNMNTHRFSFFDNSQESAFTIFKDRSGITWVGTSYGLLKINPRMQLFHHFKLTTRFPEFAINTGSTAAAQPPGEDILYIGSILGDGVYRMDRKTNAISSFPYFNDQGQMQPLHVQDMLYSKSGTLWIAPRTGLYFLNKVAGRVELFKQPASDTIILEGESISDIMEDHNGNIWLVIWNLGLVKMDATTRKMTLYSDFTDDGCQYGQNCTIDEKGNVWVGAGPEELMMLEAGSGNVISYRNALAGAGNDFWCITGIEQDRNGMIWVATKGRGLMRIDPTLSADQRPLKLKIADGLPSLSIYSLIKDKNGKLWMTTGKGVSRLDPVTMEIRTFTRSEGVRLVSGDYSISPLSTGEIFVSGQRSFSLFHPDSLEHNPNKRPVVFESFKVFDEELPLEKNLNYMDHIELSYTQNFFTFAFVGLNYSFPEKTQYAYKLDGVNNDWINNGTHRQANYTSVAPGTYTFRVKAANSDGVWNEEETSIDITITPPFWQTWWFYSLCVLAITGIVYLIFRYRISQVKKREQLKARFEKELATVRMTALNAQMNPHFLFNCLNSIKLYIIRSDLVAASDYLAKFARMIRLVLENSKSQKIALSNELEALSLYIELEALRFEQRFVYKLDIDESMDMEVIEIPPLLLQPYIENAIWHGLMHKQGKGMLGIRLWRENGYLHCVIEDDGIGRKKAQELKSKSAVKHKSMGMKINTDRIAMTNKLYDMNASITITDLEDEKGEAAGTRVSLRIPVS